VNLTEEFFHDILQRDKADHPFVMIPHERELVNEAGSWKVESLVPLTSK